MPMPADTSLPAQCLAVLDRAADTLTSAQVFGLVDGAASVTDVCRALNQLHKRQAVLRFAAANADGTRYRYAINRAVSWSDALGDADDTAADRTAPAVAATPPPPESFALQPLPAPRAAAAPRRYSTELKRRVLQRLAQMVSHDIAVVLLDIDRDLSTAAAGH